MNASRQFWTRGTSNHGPPQGLQNRGESRRGDWGDRSP